LQAGKFMPVNDISDNETEVYRYPFCNGNGKRGFVERFNAWGAHPLIGRQGALCGDILKILNLFVGCIHVFAVFLWVNKSLFRNIRTVMAKVK
jgi:type I restriction enzyme S subunit